MFHRAPRWLAACLLAPSVAALELDVNSGSSIKSATSNVAWNMMQIYTGNNTGDVPGNLPQPYYWWEAGAMFGHLVDYWYYTGDNSYTDETIQAIVWQASDNGFMPSNQTRDEGNDDQAFWAFTALDAAELKYPPPTANAPSWVAMAQAVLNLQDARWDAENCGGGLRWQIYSINKGWDYKNVAANGGYFLLAARLARYTGNSSYVTSAEKSWNWFSQSGLYNNQTFQINDGITIQSADNCTANVEQYSYNYGLIFAGLAYMYNHTHDEKWLPPLNGILNKTFSTFFPHGNKVMSEIICEPTKNCDSDALTFKSFTLRWLAVTAQLVPTLADSIWPYIEASASAAANQCDGTFQNQVNVCGMSWDTSTWDGTQGPGQQMCALAVMGANMIRVKNLDPPLTLVSGGTSKSDPSAGTSPSGSGGADGNNPVYTDPVTTGDRAGAGILTALMLLIICGGTYWLIF